MGLTFVPATQFPRCHHPDDFHVELMRGMKDMCKSRGLWLRLVLNMRQIHHCQTAILTNGITESAVHAGSVSSTCKCRLLRDRPQLPFACQNRIGKLIFGYRHITE